jgi:HAD superfamily hydrolase (TIGR01509 family)
MIKAIFWDNDGVLVDTERLYFQATQEVMAAAGRPLSEADYIEYFLRQGTGAWHLLTGVSADEVTRLRQARNDRYSDLLRQEACAIDGAAGVLKQLHGRYTMGIVTSSRRDHFELIHERCDLLRYVDFVLTSDEFPRAKPHPDPYLMAIARTGLTADECVAVEDSERGLQSASAAGIRCLVIPTLLTAGGTFAAATRVVDRIGDIPAALENL